MLATRGTRTSTRLGVLGLAAVAMTLLSGCGVVSFGTQKTASASVPSVAASATGSGSTAPSAPSAPATGGTVTGAQAQILAALPKRPATAKAWTLAQDPTAVGLLTPQQFILADYTAAAQASELGIQKERGLQYAARQNWFDQATGIYVDTFVIHYSTASGAQSDYLILLKGDSKKYDAQGSYTVPGIAQSKVFVKAKLDSYGNSMSLGLAVVGDNVLRTLMLNPAAPDHATLTGLLTGEYKALGQ
ncbi:hypothetical protein ABH931_004916 [Streptacidiphilus sp. MAP12-33]|uniref:hypothetical protein n=1 Tax=Streptacidiphilus sp. MAP12-33 TaxID=3156266 RepID=UPI003514B38B